METKPLGCPVVPEVKNRGGGARVSCRHPPGVGCRWGQTGGIDGDRDRRHHQLSLVAVLHTDGGGLADREQLRRCRYWHESVDRGHGGPHRPGGERSYDPVRLVGEVETDDRARGPRHRLEALGDRAGQPVDFCEGQRRPPWIYQEWLRAAGGQTPFEHLDDCSRLSHGWVLPFGDHERVSDSLLV